MSSRNSSFIILLISTSVIQFVAGVGDAMNAFRRLSNGNVDSPMTPSDEQGADPEFLRMESFCRALEETQCIATIRCDAIYADFDEFNLFEGVYERKFIECITSDYYRGYLKARRYQSPYYR